MGLEDLREEVVYTLVRGLPAPTAHPRAATQHIMHELPRRVNGMHPRVAAREAVCQGLFTSYTEHTLPLLVPPRLRPDYEAVGALCKIKKGIDYCLSKMKKIRCKNKQDDVVLTNIHE